MAANTITFDYNGSPIELTQINEANGSSLYRLRDSHREYTVNVRHTTEKAVAGGVALDRHNLEFTVRTFPTADLPLGSTESAYVVMRSNPNSDGSGSVDIATSLASILAGNYSNLTNGLTTLEDGV